MFRTLVEPSLKYYRLDEALAGQFKGTILSRLGSAFTVWLRAAHNFSELLFAVKVDGKICPAYPKGGEDHMS